MADFLVHLILAELTDWIQQIQQIFALFILILTISGVRFYYGRKATLIVYIDWPNSFLTANVSLFLKQNH